MFGASEPVERESRNLRLGGLGAPVSRTWMTRVGQGIVSYMESRASSIQLLTPRELLQ